MKTGGALSLARKWKTKAARQDWRFWNEFSNLRRSESTGCNRQIQAFFHRGESRAAFQGRRVCQNQLPTLREIFHHEGITKRVNHRRSFEFNFFPFFFFGRRPLCRLVRANVRNVGDTSWLLKFFCRTERREVTKHLFGLGKNGKSYFLVEQPRLLHVSKPYIHELLLKREDVFRELKNLELFSLSLFLTTH